MRTLLRRRHHQNRNALSARYFRAVRSLRRQAIQPRNARSEIQGQVDCRRPRYDDRRSLRVFQTRSVRLQQNQNARRSGLGLHEARSVRHNAFGRRSAARKARHRTFKAFHGQNGVYSGRAYHGVTFLRCGQAFKNPAPAPQFRQHRHRHRT